MFSLIWSIIVGAIVGWIANLFVHIGALGFWGSAAVGVVGSFLGGFIATLFNKPAPGSKFHPAGFVLSIIGAVILLIILKVVLH